MLVRVYEWFSLKNRSDMNAEGMLKMVLSEAIMENGFSGTRQICIYEGWGRKGTPD